MVYIAPNGRKFASQYGSKAQVMHGTAYMTNGGKTKDAWTYNKWGRIVSRARSEWGTKHGAARLQASGFSLFKRGGPGVVTPTTRRRPSAVRRRA